MEHNLRDFIATIKPNKRLLALDVGVKKVGLALSDNSLTIASPYGLITRTNFKDDVKKIANILDEFEIAGLVIGLPITMNGQEGDSCVRTREFVKKILDKIDIAIYMQDERLSTQAATRILIETNINRKKRELLDDKIAACFILQGVLDKIKHLYSS